jgi:hypothetical protein
MTGSVKLVIYFFENDGPIAFEVLFSEIELLNAGISSLFGW